jgi:rhamnosyltransferase
MQNTVAIIVTYNPDMEQLKKTVTSIVRQISYCIVIDNGNTEFDFKSFENVVVVNLGSNYGVAYAQNKGIAIAFQYSADFIILSDQDTIYPENFVEKNYIAYKQLENHKLAALVPVFFNSIKKVKNPIMVKKFSATKNFSKTYIKTSQAIASGSFIIVNSLKKIGGMNEKLFIDYVDFEWCWRADALG